MHNNVVSSRRQLISITREDKQCNCYNKNNAWLADSIHVLSLNQGKCGQQVQVAGGSIETI